MKKIVILILGCVLLSSLRAQDNNWTFRTELSYVKTSGNSSAETAAAKIEVALKEDTNRFHIKVHYIRSLNDGVARVEKLMGESKYEHIFSGSFFGYIGMDYLRDRFAGFKHRLSVGPGFGFDIVNTKKHILKVYLSAVYFYEKYSADTLASEQFFSSKAGLSYEWKIRENIFVKSLTNFALSFKNSDKYYINQEITLEVAMTNKLSLGISYVLNYQNLPSLDDIKRTDTTFHTSLILTL